MRPDELQAQLMATFSLEAAEHVQTMNENLLALENGCAADVREQRVAELFRAAHSLKGAARAVSLADVEALSHQLEDAFAKMRQPQGESRAEALDGAFQTLDSIDALLRESVGGETAAPATTHPAEETVRIATDKLDALIAAVGELVVSKIGAERRAADIRALDATLEEWESSWSKLEEAESRLHAVRGQLSRLRRLFDNDARRAAQITADLQDAVRRMRMLPVASVFEPLPRMVRDLAHDSGKEVALLISGGETEIDRAVLERIKDPLTHLLRNAVDHGIETPEVRARAGKPPTATISLSAEHRGDLLVLEVTDDGAGIDVEAVRASAVDSGLLTRAAAAELSERQASSLIFRSGFTTSSVITGLSGRGVGLDVVREAVELLHGSIEVDSSPGASTTFSVSLPLWVSTMHCLLVQAEGQTFALPVSAVERVIRAAPEDLLPAAGRETVRIDGRPVIVSRLSEVLALKSAGGGDRQSRRPIVVLGGPDRRAAFLVDSLVQIYEVVIKGLPEPLSRVPHLAGATILGTGQVAMLLSPTELIASAERDRAAAPARMVAPDVAPPTVLVVEDSITTRTLEKNILETAGYRVRVAADGGEAWTLLESDDCDLIVADIEMPVMDGFELTARIRSDERHRDLPVVLVTSRDAQEDRERGIRAGADAYIVKGSFQQERLLDTIRRLT
jgi:two-component system chemotaxis sensor kinase CheA